MSAAQNFDIIARLNRIMSGADERGLDETECLAIRDAADEIERLRKEAFHLAANQCHSGYAGEYGHHRCSEIDRLTAERDEARREIERLRQERDEARWEVCGFHHLTGFLAGDYAISRGWSYFNDKRKWPEFPPSVSDFDRFLKAQDQIFLDMIDRVTKERDEARRAACKGEAIIRLQRNRVHRESEEVVLVAKEISIERGWDCFKENTND